MLKTFGALAIALSLTAQPTLADYIVAPAFTEDTARQLGTDFHTINSSATGTTELSDNVAIAYNEYGEKFLFYMVMTKIRAATSVTIYQLSCTHNTERRIFNRLASDDPPGIYDDSKPSPWVEPAYLAGRGIAREYCQGN